MIFSLIFFISLVCANSCTIHKVSGGDICYDIAKNSGITLQELEDYNKRTLGWFGCENLQIGQIMCVSAGDPPESDMECSKYIECPINACCSRYGYCGMSEDFCGADCISNCGLPSSPSGFTDGMVKSAFWLDDEYFNDDGEYDTIFYSFAEITPDLKSIKVGENFDTFKNIEHSKKIVSIGGWDFSTSPSTYGIMRQAILEDNRPLVGKVISDFVQANNLNGVNFDWEYPGEPDIDGIPQGSPEDGPNYSGLVQTVKNNLGGGFEVSVALPASFWYLKNFPLSTMKTYIDYFVFMNYDYSGQWDYGKANTGLNCHVDQTRTVEAFKMLNKAGVPMSKVYGGLASYGRSYELSHTNCVNYMCGFTGPESRAQAGDLSRTPGILYEKEIDNLTGGVFNATSKCFYTTYNDGKDWVAWMKESDRGYLTDTMRHFGVAGTALWALNYNSDFLDNKATAGDYDDVGEDIYFDPYDCANSLDNTLGCHYEIANDFIIKNVTNALNIINDIMNDYDNYLKYYDAYIRSYYDSVMLKYDDWYLHQNGKDFYTKRDDSDIDITPAGRKRQYDSLNMIGNKTDIIELMNSMNVSSMMIDYDTYDSIGVQLVNDTLLPGLLIALPPITVGTCSDMVILDEDKQEAIDSFNAFAGTKFGTDVFVQRTKDKSFSDPRNSNRQYNFHKCTILNSYKLFPNVLKDVTRDNIDNIQNIINSAQNAMFKEYGSDIYETLELTLIYSEIAEIAQITYNDGKKQYKEYQKQKKLLIVEIVFGIIGVGTLFVSPIASAIADIALLISVSAINGEVDPESLILSLFGIFSPILKGITMDTKFTNIFKELSGLKSKNYAHLDKFKYIRQMRKQLGKPSCG